MLLVAHAAGFVTVKVVWEQNHYTCLQQFEYRVSSLLEPNEPNDSFTVVSKGNYQFFKIYILHFVCMHVCVPYICM